MNNSRTKNASRNIFFGVLYRIEATICPFLMRTVLLYTLGIEYLGLNSLFTSLLSFLSLAELGIGNALVYAMYKPMADKNNEKICSLLNLYKKLYKIIGTVILLIGLILLPFLKFFVKDGQYPLELNIYILYLIYLFNTVISYFLFGYKQSILLADQRNDIISKRTMVVQLIMYVVQIIALLCFKNYYVYLIFMPIFTVLTNFVNSYIVDRYYPQYICKGEVTLEEGKRIKKNVLALIGGQISSTILSSSDNLILSAFIGLTTVAIYGNYYYIICAVVGFTSIIYSSLTAGVGNSLVVESMTKNYSDFKLLSFMNAWLVGWCGTCILCLLQPFMRIWMGEKLMFPLLMVILFTIYFYAYQINKIVLTYKDAAGIWWEDRFRPYVVMTVNLLFNIISVQFIGVYGVILSTVVSLVISVPWSSYTLFKYLFKQSVIPYLISSFKYICIFVIGCAISYFTCSLLPKGKIVNLITSFFVCCFIPNIWFVLVNARNPELLKCIEIIKSILKGRNK